MGVCDIISYPIWWPKKVVLKLCPGGRLEEKVSSQLVQICMWKGRFEKAKWCGSITVGREFFSPRVEWVAKIFSVKSHLTLLYPPPVLNNDRSLNRNDETINF